MNPNKMMLFKADETVGYTLNLKAIESIESYYLGCIVHLSSGKRYIIKDSPLSIKQEIEKAELIALRDHFAAAAIPALIASLGNIPLVALRAYQIADYMIYEREQKGSERYISTGQAS